VSTKRVAAQLFPLLVKEDKRLAKTRKPVSPTDRAKRYAAALQNLGAGHASLLACHLVSTANQPLTLESCEKAISDWAKADIPRRQSIA
jgi:hypothetical protein